MIGRHDCDPLADIGVRSNRNYATRRSKITARAQEDAVSHDQFPCNRAFRRARVRHDFRKGSDHDILADLQRPQSIESPNAWSLNLQIWKTHQNKSDLRFHLERFDPGRDWIS